MKNIAQLKIKRGSTIVRTLLFSIGTMKRRTGTFSVGGAALVFLLSGSLALAAPPKETPPVSEPVEVYGTVDVEGTVSVDEPIDVNVLGTVPVIGTVNVGNTVEVQGGVNVNNPVDVNVTHTVPVEVTKTVPIQGVVNVGNPVSVAGPVQVEGTVSVAGPIQVEGTVSAQIQEPLQIDVTQTQANIWPVQFGGFDTFVQRQSDGLWGAEFEFGPIPDGKMLIVEHVSVRAWSNDIEPHAGNGRMNAIDTSVTPNISYKAQIYFNLEEMRFTSSAVANFPVRYYVEQNDLLRIIVTLNPEDPDGTADVSIIGHLVDTR